MLKDPLKSRIPVRLHPYWALLKVALISYAIIRLLSFITLELIIDKGTILDSPIESRSAVIFAISFFLFSTPIIYLFNCLLARSWIKIEFKAMLLHIGVIMFFASFLEVLIDSIFVEAIGRPSWEYHVWPRYKAYTSGVCFIMWPMYGFHLYLFKRAMTKIGSPLMNSLTARSVMLAIDAMIMETIANMFALIAFKSYYFYYLRGDILHFTTLEIFIPYVIVGFLTMAALRFLETSRVNGMIVGAVALVLGWAVLAIL